MLHDSHLAKHGAGFVSAVGHVLSDAGEYGVGLINRAGNFIAKHGDTIDNLGHVINLGSSIGVLGGLISADTGARIQAGAAGMRKKKKKGAGWVDYT